MTKDLGKIKISVLIISSVVVAFFILVGFIEIYKSSNISPNQQPVASSTVVIITGNNTNAPSSTANVATSSIIKIPPTVISQPISTIPAPTSSISIPPPISVVDIGHTVGISAGGVLSKISTSTLNQELNQMVALGATWVRFDIEWGDVQYSSSSSFTWSSYDYLVNALAAHHLNGLAIILFTPQWARTPGCVNGVECTPENPTTFATFASEVAARYQGKIKAYEVWNEPNNYDFWAPETDCDAYTALLKVTYPAIKEADPNAVVITGGLAPESTYGANTSPTDFLSCIYANGGEPYFDAVGDHPYSFPAVPSQVTAGAWAQMSTTMPSLRSIMVANGDANKKIWITEFGAPTDGPDPHWYVSEAAQSAMVTNAMSLYETYSWAGPFFWYTLEDGGTSTSTNENFFGLIRADGSLKPAYTTLQSVISEGL